MLFDNTLAETAPPFAYEVRVVGAAEAFGEVSGRSHGRKGAHVTRMGAIGGAGTVGRSRTLQRCSLGAVSLQSPCHLREISAGSRLSGHGGRDGHTGGPLAAGPQSAEGSTADHHIPTFHSPPLYIPSSTDPTACDCTLWSELTSPLLHSSRFSTPHATPPICGAEPYFVSGRLTAQPYRRHASTLSRAAQATRRCESRSTTSITRATCTLLSMRSTSWSHSEELGPA